MGRKRAVLIESHAWLRQNLRQLLLDAGLEVVDEAPDVVEGVRLAVATCPEIVVVDTDLTEMSGSLLGQLIQMLVPLTRVVLLVDDKGEYRQLAEDRRVAACIDKRQVSQVLTPIVKRLLEDH